MVTIDQERSSSLGLKEIKCPLELVALDPLAKSAVDLFRTHNSVLEQSKVKKALIVHKQITS
jgi:hypothetical protein